MAAFSLFRPASNSPETASLQLHRRHLHLNLLLLPDRAPIPPRRARHGGEAAGSAPGEEEPPRRGRRAHRPAGLTSTRREALSLYRAILRATRLFTWPDTRGVPWRDVLRENARRDFEDPEVLTRLLIGGRDAVQKALEKLVEANKKVMADFEAKVMAEAEAEAEDQRRGGR